MGNSDPIAGEDLRGQFGFTADEEEQLTVGRELLFSQIRAHKLAKIAVIMNYGAEKRADHEP